MRRSMLVAVLCGLLAGCAGDPSSPSTPDEPFVLQAASFGSTFTIEPRRINVACNVGQSCSLQVIVSSSRPVTLDWGLDAGGIILGTSSCPVVTNFFGECTIDMLVDTSHPARYSGRLTIGDFDTGTYKTFRVTARVS
jgi:hypothetical protein